MLVKVFLNDNSDITSLTEHIGRPSSYSTEVNISVIVICYVRVIVAYHSNETIGMLFYILNV